MPKPLALRLGNRTSLTAVPPAHGGNCGDHVSPPFSSNAAASPSSGADSIGGRSSSLPADAPVSVRVMHALKKPPHGRNLVMATEWIKEENIYGDTMWTSSTGQSVMAVELSPFGGPTARVSFCANGDDSDMKRISEAGAAAMEAEANRLGIGAIAPVKLDLPPEGCLE